MIVSCKRQALFILMMFVFTGATASIITYDEAEFFRNYGSPSEIIDFTTLKDGTTYENITHTHPFYGLGTHSSDSWGKWQIRDHAWSDNYLIRTRTWSGGFKTVTRWDGNSIGNVWHPSTIVPFSIASLIDPTPFAMYITSTTYSGFVGIIPEHDTENHFFYYPPGGATGVRINEVQFGFSPISPTPEPETFTLILSGLIMLPLLRFSLSSL